MKIVSIVGTRPQFIKIPLLSKELRKYHDEVIVHTGQHYDFALSDTFFEELDIPKPDYNLGVGSGLHGYQTGEMLKKIEDVLLEEKPELVIVYGDTNSTLAGALAASKLNVKLAHVEAGMRNFDREKPEEINRILTDHVSDLLFAPTRTAVKNLAREGIRANVHLVGDVGSDVLLKFQDVASEHSDILEKIGIQSKKYCLLTIHKQKNTDNYGRLSTIVGALQETDENFVFPAHPRTVKFLKAHALLDSILNSNIRVLEPLGYFDFLKLLCHAKKVVTDSGGVQKEAYTFKVPCITLRETEWIETVQEGWNKVVELSSNEIRKAVKNFEPTGQQKGFLGNGDAFLKIVDILNGS